MHLHISLKKYNKTYKLQKEITRLIDTISTTAKRKYCKYTHKYLQLKDAATANKKLSLATENDKVILFSLFSNHRPLLQ